jgi:GTP-binding protein HflX
MKRVFGHTRGLKTSQLKRIENLSRRRTPPDLLISPELRRDVCLLSSEINRQLGLLIDRQGRITHVLVGDAQGIFIPDLSTYRVASGRLRGLRCVHTHLKAEALSTDDLTDLALLRLDLMAAMEILPEGQPGPIHWATVHPGKDHKTPFQHQETLRTSADLDIDCEGLIQALEAEFAQARARGRQIKGVERGFLISVTNTPRKKAMDSLAELHELARTNGIQIQETILQLPKRIDPRFLMGRGKLKEIALLALTNDATMLVFDQELNPSQSRSISEQIDLKVIDRTQLILDIFAQRAQTREGKLQVELAQLRYMLPRLTTKNTAMSRLTGGIGGRGPGETKLEINRRRVRDRITRLDKSLKTVQKNRQQQRQRREKRGLPVISIIGYTNAGKSTLLNTLTRSRVLAENKLFATLDPSSRRLKFPRDREVIITDTVGFIKNLPKELLVAFRATLEELSGADLLLHVIDISNPRHKAQVRSVERLLAELKLDTIAEVRALNKIDRVSQTEREAVCQRLKGVPICARQADSLRPLLELLDEMLPVELNPEGEGNRFKDG